MRLFRWLSIRDIPERCDLRRCGWKLIHASRADAPDLPTLAEYGAIDAGRWVDLLSPKGWDRRGRILLFGVDCAEERSRLLRLGFGDVLGLDAKLAEVDARIGRLGLQVESLPRTRICGKLHLDLLLRDVFAEGRAAHLHPREFALLWRLADQPGRILSRARLTQDVLRLSYLPETNAIAVHICRLRDKLAAIGCDGMIRTAACGGYYLSLETLREPLQVQLRAGRVARPRLAGARQASVT